MEYLQHMASLIRLYNMKKIYRYFVFLVAALMFSTGAVYFLAAYLESVEDISEHGAQVEIILFTVVGITHMPFGVWMLKNRLNSRAPYVISTVISLSLIGLYVIAKMITMPIVGLESDVGVVDAGSKVLQVVIVIISVMLSQS